MTGSERTPSTSTITWTEVALARVNELVDLVWRARDNRAGIAEAKVHVDVVERFRHDVVLRDRDVEACGTEVGAEDGDQFAGSNRSAGIAGGVDDAAGLDGWLHGRRRSVDATNAADVRIQDVKIAIGREGHPRKGVRNGGGLCGAAVAVLATLRATACSDGKWVPLINPSTVDPCQGHQTRLLQVHFAPVFPGFGRCLQVCDLFKSAEYLLNFLHYRRSRRRRYPLHRPRGAGAGDCGCAPGM